MAQIKADEITKLIREQIENYESKITVDNKLTKVPSILLPVTTVDKSNIATTVIADGFVTKAQLCKGIAAACKAAGL